MSPPGPSRDPVVPPGVAAADGSRPRRVRPRPSSETAWLLRTTAVVGFLAALAGVLVAPGLRGLARDRVVDAGNRVAWTLAYAMCGLLAALIVMATLEVSRTARRQTVWTGIGVSAAGLALALAAPALLRPLQTSAATGLAVVTSFAVLVGAAQGFRARHTRAVALVMISLATAAIFRVVAWNLARAAGDWGSTQLYATARVVATVALGFEALAQMIAAAWLGTRSRLGGQALASVAIGLAWILTFSASRGANATASRWEGAAHVAVASALGLPHPYGPDGLAVFLLAASILLAGVAAAQRRQVVAVVMALSLSLIARGVFDVPLHALAAAAAAVWLTRVAGDERAMWEAILASRETRRSSPR
jgi:hypothetical protein